jgi:hypothetical protein
MVKEFFVVGSDDHSNDNPKIVNTDLRHVSLFFPSPCLSFGSPLLLLDVPSFSSLNWIL